MTNPAFPSRLSTRPESELLAQETGMGAIVLRVADLDLMTRYYENAVRLAVLSHDVGSSGRPARTVLGRLGVPIVILEHSPELKHAGDHQAGLYHTAIVFEREEDLAAAVYSTAMTAPGSFTGSSDHLVSKAFYFDDPEGNGVELYFDRPQSEWKYVDGRPDIGGIALDANGYLNTHLTEQALNESATRAAKVGHIHLSVGDVDTAEHFYADILGFEKVARFPTGVFVSAGGYHHHMGMNSFNSKGAGPRQLTLGLGVVRIEVPTPDDLGQLGERLRHHVIEVRDDGECLRLSDPWANEVEVRVRALRMPHGRAPSS